jgi:hypothetical protein
MKILRRANFMENIEFWKPIKGYENYEISSFGRVKNVKFNKLIFPHLSNGYERIGLANNGKQVKFRVNRLVAQAFINPSIENIEVDHIDRIKTNNHVSNLRCVNRKDNSNNLNKSKIFKLVEFINTISNENSLKTIEELTNHLNINNLEMNKHIKNLLK